MPFARTLQSLSLRTLALAAGLTVLRRDNVELRASVESMRNELKQVHALLAALTRDVR